MSDEKRPFNRATLWLSQGDDPNMVQVWLLAPVLKSRRWELPEGAPHLLASGNGVVNAKFAVWARDVVLKEFHVTPDTYRELIRVEGVSELKPPKSPPKA